MTTVIPPPQLEQIDPSSVVLSESTVHPILLAVRPRWLVLDDPPVVGGSYSRSYLHSIPDDFILSGDSHSLRGHFLRGRFCNCILTVDHMLPRSLVCTGCIDVE